MKQLSEVSYLRCFAVIMIVLWHCYFCPVICWPVFDNANANNLYMMAMRVVGLFAFPDCVMPLFTFLSGYLFYYLFKEKNKYQDFKPFFINKLNRLFIPFLVLGSVISITSPDRYLEQVMWGEGSALWFSAMLFWCFLLAWVPLYIKSFSISMLFFLTSLAFNAYSISVWTTPCELILGLDNSLFYLHYFIAGEIAYKYRDSIYEIFNKKLLLLLIIFYVAVAAAILIKIPLIIHLRTIIQSYLFILIALRISLNFSTREIPIGGGYLYIHKI